MATWAELVHNRPDLASAGTALLYQHGVGLAFLGTVSGNGRPRVHPVCPLLTESGLFAFIVPSPKQSDLRRDGRYALHSFPSPDNEDAFYLSGQAYLVENISTRSALSDQFVEERAQFGVAHPAAVDALFRFEVSSCLLTRTTGHGDPAPSHVVWHAPRDGVDDPAASSAPGRPMAFD
jgi:hypothetical protein